MTQKRAITILRGDTELDRQVLDLFRLPDGSTAAKWGGLVFPIRSEDRIEVTEPGYRPAECQPWEDDVSKQELGTIADGMDSYVFVEGDAKACSRIARRLTDAGLEVLRTGPNLSGTAGDWFIRLGPLPAGGEQRLATALVDAGTASPDTPEQPLRERLLVQALVNSQASKERLSAELQRTRQLVLAASVDENAQEELTHALESMATRLAEVEAEAGELRKRLETAPKAAAPGRPNRLVTELEVAAAALLPRLDFIGTTMRFICVELPDRAILWRSLAELDRQERGIPPAWKSLSGQSGWWERHFSTGQDNQGRIYARATGTPARWQVLVSHKQDQPMDLKRISRM